MTTLEANAAARATAITWRCPPDISPTAADRSGNETLQPLEHARSSSRPSFGDAAPASVEAANVGPASSRPAKKLAAGPRLSNRARSWYTVSIPWARAAAGELIVAGCAVDLDLAGIESMHAADALDQGRLAGAVVAEQRDDLAMMHVEVE